MCRLRLSAIQGKTDQTPSPFSEPDPSLYTSFPSEIDWL